MTLQLQALCWDATDPLRLARFWAGTLGRELASADDATGVALLPSDGTSFRIRLQPTQEPKVGRNQMHLHLTSTSLQDQQQTVARALALGARHIDVGQRPEEGHVVLADPEDNEFCVIEPGNSFLTDCGFLGELACDGSQEVGYFWSKALGWQLVWDQDQETAIQSPGGGTKIAWGGPPLAPRAGEEGPAGPPRRWRRGRGRTGATSTSLHLPTVISRRRSSDSSRSGRRGSTWARARSAAR